MCIRDRYQRRVHGDFNNNNILFYQGNFFIFFFCYQINMGCGGSKSKPDKKQVDKPQQMQNNPVDIAKVVAPAVVKQDSMIKTIGAGMSLASSAADSIPIIGGIVSGTLKILGILLINIDGFEQLPEELMKGKNKLVQVQNLLQDILDKQDLNPSLTLIFFDELKKTCEEYHAFIDERLRNQKTTKKLIKLLEIFSGQGNIQKMEELNVKIDKAIQQFQISKIYDDVTDQFPEQIKKTYRGRAGYNSWVYCFRNQEYVPVNRFIENYSENQNLDPQIIKSITDYIDMDKNQEISFREFMGFVSGHIQFYDSKGSSIKMPNELITALKNQLTSGNQAQVNNRQIRYPNGDLYEGDIKDGKKHGKGVYTQGDAYKYDGEYQNDQKHGFGQESDNGNKYSGQWENNQKQGQGTWEFKYGGKYEGAFVRNQQNGLGKLTETDGTIYTGKWVDGQMVEGSIVYKDGSKYEGQTKNTKFREGKGIMYDKQNQIQFSGDFKDNLPLARADQQACHVVWYDGKQHGSSYYAYQLFTSIEKAQEYYNKVEVESKYAKVLVTNQVQSRYGLDYYVRCCIGYILKKDILKIDIIENKFFVYDIHYKCSDSFDTEAQAKEAFNKLEVADKCIVNDKKIIQKAGVNYEDAWLGQYAIYQMNRSKDQNSTAITYHLIWFDGDNVHNETSDYYGYRQSENLTEITQEYNNAKVTEGQGKVIFSSHIELKQGHEYYVSTCIGFAYRSGRIRIQKVVKQYYVFNNPGHEIFKFDDEQSANKKYDELNCDNKCILKEGKLLKSQGANYQDAWLGYWITSFT
eukprot:TRINITY_DN710_c0_g2_i2.p1 TRINITY_DN710_c0_g2~~TRINITY_DN710_c0_g2_i2.p1  ORF type:complete len:803 (-),score=190.89 TRINITY_DN710_c0_g2_i2:247-2655(-)